MRNFKPKGFNISK